MVKYPSSLVIAALIAAPAFASYEWHTETRELTDHELFGRELSNAEATVFAREMEELYARLPEDISARELQELVARGLGAKIRHAFHKIWGGIKKVAGMQDTEEVFARHHDVRDLDALYERYMQEIEERTPNFLDFMHTGMDAIKKIAHPELPPAHKEEPLDVRDILEELYERDMDIDDLD
ncbi:hypothetical protein B0H34DRAFT_675663 [Crassisporium funariophilum]|nr:hypothetical protein B0H34DRAFT_675663 [Crassisporium funariophilum]